MDPGEETLNLLNKIWLKLQQLPNANPIELGAFFVMLIFILLVSGLMIFTCVTCCCCRNKRTKSSNIWLKLRHFFFDTWESTASDRKKAKYSGTFRSSCGKQTWAGQTRAEVTGLGVPATLSWQSESRIYRLLLPVSPVLQHSSGNPSRGHLDYKTACGQIDINDKYDSLSEVSNVRPPGHDVAFWAMFRSQFLLKRGRIF